MRKRRIILKLIVRTLRKHQGDAVWLPLLNLICAVFVLRRTLYDGILQEVHKCCAFLNIGHRYQVRTVTAHNAQLVRAAKRHVGVDPPTHT